MSEANRKRGWDKKTVNRIAKSEYGGLAEMFRAHSWIRDGKTYGQIAPTRVKHTYGSIDAFERAHKTGLENNSLYSPIAAIRSNPPNVWLTSYYCFDPENWGLLAFGSESDRAKFIAESEPGALIIVYGTKSLSHDEAGKVLGVQQVSHAVGPSEHFISSASWAIKQSNPQTRERWLYGVQSTRAWSVVPEERPSIEAFADESWSPKAGRAIGRYCKRMTSKEARKLLDLEMFETSVFEGRQVDGAAFAKGKDLLRPSRPGPVSQNSFRVSESEGPKHLYILELCGKQTDAFVEEKIKGRRIVKVGFSKSPETRCSSFNRALPGKEFVWRVCLSTAVDGSGAYPSSHHAKAGEQRMVQYLDNNGSSLGGEFFLADDELIAKAWVKGKKMAREFVK